jgi:hypothetical protein
MRIRNKHLFLLFLIRILPSSLIPESINNQYRRSINHCHLISSCKEIPSTFVCQLVCYCSLNVAHIPLPVLGDMFMGFSSR